VPGRFVVDQSEVIRSAEADPDYTVRPHARSAQGNKRLLKSDCFLASWILRIAAVLPKHGQNRPEMSRFYRAELHFESREAKT